MPDDDDISLSEKRMYRGRREATRAFVASPMGVAAVDASDDQIGRFGLEHQCNARDVAGRNGQLLVATDEDVLVGDGGGFEPAGFGPAVAVGVGKKPLAVGEDGRVARLVDGDWETVDVVDAVQSVDGDWIAAADGVYHVDDTLSHVGLDDVQDVAASDGTAHHVFAATTSGLYRYEDGWDRAVDGEATLVATDGDRVHAVVGGNLLERTSDGTWTDADAPTGGVVDVAYDEATFAVTADGQVLLDPVTAKDGAPEWRSRSLGLADVVGIAIP